MSMNATENGNYRILNEGEIVKDTDQMWNDEAEAWVIPNFSVGKPAPNADFTPHRFFRRPVLGVKRYSQATGGDLEEYEKGDWVKFKDFEQLAKEAENLALSLESAGYGRHLGGKMCTPLERYRS